MLVLKLERWPQGDPRRAETLCTGTEEVGHYDAVLQLPDGAEHFRRVENFARGPSALRAWQLVSEALRRVWARGR
jgi:hypothetical protein